MAAQNAIRTAGDRSSAQEDNIQSRGAADGGQSSLPATYIGRAHGGGVRQDVATCFWGILFIPDHFFVCTVTGRSLAKVRAATCPVAAPAGVWSGRACVTAGQETGPPPRLPIGRHLAANRLPTDGRLINEPLGQTIYLRALRRRRRRRRLGGASGRRPAPADATGGRLSHVTSAAQRRHLITRGVCDRLRPFYPAEARRSGTRPAPAPSGPAAAARWRTGRPAARRGRPLIGARAAGPAPPSAARPVRTPAGWKMLGFLPRPVAGTGDRGMFRKVVWRWEDIGAV